MLDAGLVRGQAVAVEGSLGSSPVWPSFAAILELHKSSLAADQEEGAAPAFGLVDVEEEAEAGSCVALERKAGAPGHTADVHPFC
jgi:hypothetical protein